MANRSDLGSLIDGETSLALTCWRCKRRVVLTPAMIEHHATRGFTERIGSFSARCKCSGCGARSPNFVILWGKHQLGSYGPD